MVMKRQEYIELFSGADLSALSPRQKQYAESLLNGMSVSETAQTLGTSKQNVSQVLKNAANSIKSGKRTKGKTFDYSAAEFPQYAENIRILTADELVAYAYRACGYTNAEVGEKIEKKEMAVATLAMKARYKLQGEEPPSRKWKQDNYEKVLDDAKKWRREHPEKCREWAERWRSENAEKDKKYKHEYYMKNRERVLKKRKEYYEENKEEILEKKKAERRKRRQQKKNVEPE